MGKLHIKRFKDWYQIVKDGYTVAQFKSRTQALSYLEISSRFPIDQMGIGEERVSQRYGYTMRRISVYP